MQSHREEDAFMVPGMGAQPVPVKEWVPANDNKPAIEISDYYRGAVESWLGQDGGQYIGLTRAVNQPPVDLQSDGSVMNSPLNVMPHAGGYVETTTAARPSAYPSAYLRGPRDPEYREIVWPERAAERIGPYIATATGGKFYPLDPRPSEVDIRHIARSHSMQCRYNGAVRRFYSVAEHVTLIARSLVKEHGKRVALAGLLHDSPEAYTGFGDVVSPMKSEFPFIGEMEDNIYRKAIAPHFGLGREIPEAVHIADMRIRGNEVANLVPMAWHEEYDNPLPVPMMYWSPAESEREFLNTYAALTGEVV